MNWRNRYDRNFKKGDKVTPFSNHGAYQCNTSLYKIGSVYTLKSNYINRKKTTGESWWSTEENGDLGMEASTFEKV